MWLAQLDTEHFEFHALGVDEEDARKTLIRGLKRHAADRDIPMNWWKDYWDGINTVEIPKGKTVIDMSWEL